MTSQLGETPSWQAPVSHSDADTLPEGFELEMPI